MRLLQSRISLRLLLSVLSYSIFVFAVPCEQTLLSAPLNSKSEDASKDTWDLSHEPGVDSTSPWIFDTVNSFLKLWPNTRLRNGHNLVAGVVPVGTLLYHGTTTNRIPTLPDWTAVDPEHSHLFCRNWDNDPLLGCWHLTLVVTRPLKVLYFDGSAASKMYGGSLDSQDILVWGNAQPNRTFDDRARIDYLCAWARDYGIHGILRMEMDFEIMLCDFTTNVEVVSFLNLRRNRHPLALNRAVAEAFRVIEAGKWHDRFPTEQRITLDYTRIISFYDTSLFPGLQSRRKGQERWDHRLKDITPDELVTLHRTLNETLQGEWGASKSGINWPALLTVLEQRHNERLELLRYILFDLPMNSGLDLKDTMKQAHRHLEDMIVPYILNSNLPNPPRSLQLESIPDFQWAAPIFEECATTHTRYLYNPTIFSTFTHSEKVLLRAAQETAKEICRVLVGMWAEGEEIGLADNGTVLANSNRRIGDVAESWKNRTQGLMNWLDWSYWSSCKPACGYEEICYLPTWPLFKHPPWGPGPPRRHPETNPHVFGRSGEANVGTITDDPGDLPKPGPDDDWYRPSPRCIRRLEPFGFE